MSNTISFVELERRNKEKNKPKTPTTYMWGLNENNLQSRIKIARIILALYFDYNGSLFKHFKCDKKSSLFADVQAIAFKHMQKMRENNNCINNSTELKLNQVDTVITFHELMVNPKTGWII